MDYPLGIQAAVLISSRGGNHAYQCAELASAYDNALVIPCALPARALIGSGPLLSAGRPRCRGSR